MISGTFQIIALLSVLIYFLVLYYLLKKKRLILKYTLLWIFSGAVMLIFAAFPELLVMVTHLMGVYSPTNALFAVISFCLIMILISVTAIVSKQNEQIKRLTQSAAMLEKRVRELEADANTKHDAENAKESVVV